MTAVTRWRFVVLLASFFLQLLVDGSVSAFGVLFVYLPRAFPEQTIASLAIPGSLQCGLFNMGGTLASLLVTIFGHQRVAMTGGVFISVGILAASQTANFVAFTILYGLVTGFGMSLVYVPSVIVVVEWLDKNRAIGLGICSAGAGVGYLVIPLLIQTLVTLCEHWRLALFVYSAICLNAIALGATFFDTPIHKKCTSSIEHLADNRLSPAEVDIQIDNSKNTQEILLNQSHDSVVDKHRLHSQSMPKLNCYLCQHNEVTEKVWRSAASFNVSNDKSQLSLAKTLHRKILYASGTIADVHSMLHNEEFENKIAKISWIKSFLKLVNISLFCRLAFVLYVIGSAFIQLGYFVPFVYLIGYSVDILRISVTKSTSMMVVLGIFHAFGRFSGGVVANQSKLSALCINNVSLALTALGCLVLPYLRSFIMVCLFAGWHGYFVAFFIPLTPIILDDILGMENLTSAFGNLSMIRGVFSIVGPLSAGVLLQVVKSNAVVFYFSASMFTLACATHTLLWFYLRYNSEENKSTHSSEP